MDAIEFFGECLELLDFIVNRRFWICFFIGVGLAYWTYRESPNEIGIAMAASFLTIGIVTGLVWNWRSRT